MARPGSSHVPRQSVLLATAQADPAADAFLAALVGEAQRYGIADCLVLLPAGRPAPAGLPQEARIIPTAAAAGSLGLLRGAGTALDDDVLILDGAGLTETNLLALPLAAAEAEGAVWAADAETGGWAGLAFLRAAALPGLGAESRPLAEALAERLPPLVVSGPYRRPGEALPWRRPAAFLDRDGVLIVDDGYPHDPAKIRWIPGAKRAVRRLNEAGYFVFVVTNQAGVARGYYPEEAVRALHRWMAGEMAAAGAHIDAWEHCPHHKDATVEAFRRDCRRRKPAPGMILDLLATWPVDVAGSFMIGDRETDRQAAAAAGLPGHLFPSDDLDRLVRAILAERPSSRTDTKS